MFDPMQILLFGVVAGLLAAGVLFTRPWSRQHRRFVVAGVATAVGFIAWNFTLNATNATGFNVDAPFIFVSWADAGSGVLACLCTALGLGWTERQEPAGRVMGAAVIAGLVALGLDLFVL
jgi:hypothetical protein